MTNQQCKCGCCQTVSPGKTFIRGHNMRKPRHNTIKNMDGMEYMRTVKDGSVDMVLTDPPYAISRKTGFSGCVNGVDRLKVSMEFGEWDNAFTTDMLADTVNEYYRILRDGGYVVIFYDLWKIESLSQILTDAGFKQLRFIEWIKTNPVPINSKTNYLTNAREIAICAVKGSKPIFTSKYDNGIYSYPIYHKKNRFHPTQKPVELFKELILKHTRPGDTVIDTFLGSGTTAMACAETGRLCKGAERDTDYYKKMIKRIDENEKQTTI